MKSHYRVVVIGGGVVGASVIYHLAKFGWSDVCMLERSVPLTIPHGKRGRPSWGMDLMEKGREQRSPLAPAVVISTLPPISEQRLMSPIHPNFFGSRFV